MFSKLARFWVVDQNKKFYNLKYCFKRAAFFNIPELQVSEHEA